MLLSHAHRFIYTKTLKTAGTSVEIYFERACLPSGTVVALDHWVDETVTEAGTIGYRGPHREGKRWYNHMPASEIRDLVGQKVWNDYFKFCVVRNPYDKVVSYWWFAFNGRDEYRRRDGDFSVIRADFSRWCAEFVANALDRDKYTIDHKIAMDYFIRYESLLDGIEHVCRQTGYKFEPDRLGRYKSSARTNKRPYADYYDRSSLAAVEAVFGWEMEFFGYSAPSVA